MNTEFGSQEEYIKVDNPKVDSLNDFAFNEAGKNSGDPTVFSQHLRSVFTGALLDGKHYHAKSESEMESIRSKIEHTRLEIDKSKNEVSECEMELQNNKEKIINLKTKKEELELGESSTGDASEVIDVFSPPKFWVTSFFLLMLSIFIFLFYVAVVYKAFFIDTQDVAESLVQGNWGVSLLPEWYEIHTALSNNLMVIFAPFVFYGFGYAIHVLLEQNNKWKYLWIGLVVLVTFVLDYLLAWQIHKQVNDALELIGAQVNSAFTDILLVIIMGFVVYIIWSIIFHYWMEELQKRDPIRRIGSVIKNLKEDNNELKKRISQETAIIDQLREKISRLSETIDNRTIPISVVVNSITEFATGWFRYINGRQGQVKNELRDQCLSMLSKYDKYEAIAQVKRSIKS